MAKRALIIRHVPYEGIAAFRQPIEEAGYVLDRVDVGDNDFSSVDLIEPDLLIMMGGPMGVYEQEQHPWIACQLRRLAKRLNADRPTLGVCLGAQMIAAAMGATVYAGPQQEVGFAPLYIHVQASPLKHLSGIPVLHWHGDTFNLPPGAQLLASSSLYRYQAFRRGRNILALQFHAEMGLDERFHDWLVNHAAALDEAGKCPLGLKGDYEALGPAAVAAGQSMIAEWIAGLRHAPLMMPSRTWGAGIAGANSAVVASNVSRN